jgi:hypothetical protein
LLKPHELAISQLYVSTESSGPRVVAKSDSVPFAFEDLAMQISMKFGSRPVGFSCPSAIFAVPFASEHVAVVQVADHLQGGLVFRFLIMLRKLYVELGDPFQIADRFTPNWSLRGSAESLSWPMQPLPSRKVEQLAEILKPDGPLFLGATQALVDGSRIMLKSLQPDQATLRGIWQLLPTRTRSELWPATFAFANDLGFHVVVVPHLPEKFPPGYLSEEQVRDYPQGRYELHLQIAVEDGDQAAVDKLFTRPSSQDMLTLALRMVGVALIGAVIARLFF